MHDEMNMVGSWPGASSVVMHKLPRELRWMHVKYGQLMQPYECTVKFQNIKGDNCGQWSQDAINNLNYSFTKRNDVRGINLWEREPKRNIMLQDPSKYRGQLGAQRSSYFFNTDRVFIVNGSCTKADGNFIGNFFFKRLGDTGITVGSYPINEVDVQQLRDAGVTAVLDIQTGTDHR